MKIVADLHFHSKYSRAVSPQMILSEIAKWAVLKGIDLVTTADFTHPLWLRELKSNLEEVESGVYRLKGQEKPLFVFTTEISSIYTQGGKLRRIHNLVFAPSIKDAEKIEDQLARKGNVMSDGRPIFGLSARDLTEVILNVSSKALIIPAHAWTPHFSVFGSESGFDSIDECFGDMTKYIYAVETGLSSDPLMNWRVGELDRRTLLSCSDAHSGSKLGREATVFNINGKNTNFTFEDIRTAIKGDIGKLEVSNTIEFYPEEGKYHYTGHRNCGVHQSPEETKKNGKICPVCGKNLTVGVMHRVEELATRELRTENLELKTDEFGVKWIGYEKRPPYTMTVPLLEILAEALKTTVSGQKATNEYKKLTTTFKGEFGVLLNGDLGKIARISGEKVAEGIQKVRSGNIVIEPGYDGVFGVVKIWKEEKDIEKNSDQKSQLLMF